MTPLSQWPNWFGEGVFDRPTELQAHIQRQIFDAESIGPITEAQALALVRNPVEGLACIAALGAVRRPATVPRLVSAVIVDAIERCMRWALAHISEKVLKHAPALADTDPALPIDAVFRVARIGRALQHVGPTVIRRIV